MKRTLAIVGSLVFFAIAPGTVAGVIPWAISDWQWQPVPFAIAPLRWLGTAFIVTGVAILLDSFARFALQGLGTPAPVYPTELLIATGLYRFVRNPMYLAVLAIIFGQALLLGDARLIVYGAIIWLAFHIFVLVYEEPTLRDRYGPQFDAYCGQVPRWRPRLTAHSQADF
jgi:protein-S-isoprenylcysteine O-methyltransferase Ste14